MGPRFSLVRKDRGQVNNLHRISNVSLILLQLLALLPRILGLEAFIVNSSPFITSDISKFGLGIEGTSIDMAGRVYATGYTGGTTSGIGTMTSTNGSGLEQDLFILDQTGSASFNGIRFLPLSEELSKVFISRAIATDVRGHLVAQFLQWNKDGRVRKTTFCGDGAMIQPNDIAVASKSGRIYLSGGNYGKVTTEIGDGDLWMCEARSSFFKSSVDDLDKVKAVRLGLFGLTNGIEISPDEKSLYLSESFHRNGVVVENKIWKFDIDATTGDIYNKTLFVDFEALDGSGWIDLDGIRTDMDGNLFVTRNSRDGEVLKFSQTGELLLTIKATGLLETTNCDLGGPHGNSLFIVGKCADDPVKGCSNVWHGNTSPGRAWTELTVHLKR